MNFLFLSLSLISYRIYIEIDDTCVDELVWMGIEKVWCFDQAAQMSGFLYSTITSDLTVDLRAACKLRPFSDECICVVGIIYLEREKNRFQLFMRRSNLHSRLGRKMGYVLIGRGLVIATLNPMCLANDNCTISKNLPYIISQPICRHNQN
jgi:hypothetical protein